MSRSPRNVVFLGATRGMGRALARMFAERGDRLFLLGRDTEGLGLAATDLAVRSGDFVGQASCDLRDPSGFDAALVAAKVALGTIDVVVITAGVFATQESLEDDAARTADLLTVDFTNTVLFCEAAKRTLLADGGGTLCVFGSVAGDRGRSPVVLYGAAKAGLAAYLEGLDHRHHRDGLRVVRVKPGFVRTSMTDGLREPPFAGEPEDVALRVMSAIDRETPEVYAPFVWGPLMRIVRSLPRAVMRRAAFLRQERFLAARRGRLRPMRAWFRSPRPDVRAGGDGDGDRRADVT